MIEINLLPEELKSRPRARRIGARIEPGHFIYLLPFVLGFLILIHIYLAGLAIFKERQLAVLTRNWERLAAQRKVLANFNKEYSLYSSEAQGMKQLFEKRLSWAQKLNKMSLLLPAGVWFREISVTPKDFSLQGSVVCLQKNDMSLIKQFIDNLKQDADFVKDFGTFELSSVQKKNIGSYGVSDFVLAGTFKSK